MTNPAANSRIVDGRLARPVMIGRVAELHRAVAALSRPPAVVVVEGEAGIGKTKLVTELAGRAELADRRFVVGGCRPIREPFPLGPLVEALRGRGDELAAARLTAVAGALRPLLPELAHMLPQAPEPLPDRAGERHRLFRGLVEVLAALAPAVLVLEDMHWADEWTVDFVTYLVSDPPDELSMVLTYRGEDVEPPARMAAARPASRVTRTHVTLAPLDAGETGRLAAAILGTEHISAEFAAYLCERTAGLPYAIQELLALLAARGSLIRRDTGWTRRAIDELNVPSGVRDSVLERLSRLSPNARAVAEAAAVLQVAVPVSALVRTCRLPRLAAVDGLDEVMGSGLIVEDGDFLDFRHALAGQAVYESIPLPRRQDLHGRAAAALRRLRPVPLGQVAHHLRHAGRLAEWTHAAERAADRALELHHHGEAARILGDVLRHAPMDVEQRGRLAVKLGWATTEALRAPDAIEVLCGVLAEDPPRAIRGELRFLLGLLYERVRSDPLRQREAYAEAVGDLGDRPDLAARAMIGLGFPKGFGVPLSEHVAWLDRALETARQIADRPMRVAVVAKVAMVLAPIGDPRWAELADQVVAQTGGAARHPWERNAYYSIGMEACYPGHYGLAERLLTAALAGEAGGDGLNRHEVTCRAGLLLLAFCRGSWRGLDAEIAFLLDALDEVPNYRFLIDAVVACRMAVQGDPEHAERRLDDVVGEAIAAGELDMVALPATFLLRLATARGAAQAAIERTARAFDLLSANGIWPVAVRALPALVEALVAVGRRDEAGRVLDRFEREARGLDAPLADPALAHGHGFLAMGEDGWRAAADRFGAAATGYAALDCRYEAAQARELAAVCAANAGDDGDDQAADLLRAAIAEYAELGARWDLGRAARHGRRLGLPGPAPHRNGSRGYGSTLSPREWEVARLASTGLTNKEIAQQLFLSTKTVDKHLSAALRKFGLRSRTALAGRLGSAGPPPRPPENGEFSP